MMNKPKQPWMSFEHGVWEVNETVDTKIIRVNIGGATVEVDKLYGPLIAEKVRVRLDRATAEWVVERQNVVTDVWNEKARWNCQESLPDYDEDAQAT